MTIPITSITVAPRLRKDYGNIADLAENISEHGLIQPIVLELVERTNIDDAGNDVYSETYLLVAGGRRFTALQQLGVTELEHGITSTPGKFGFVFTSELSPERRREIELYENLYRKAMSWQEEMLSVYEIHKLKERTSLEESQLWTETQTGRMLGVSRQTVNVMMRVAEGLIAKDKDILGASNMSDAYQILLKRGHAALQQKILAASASIVPPAPTSTLDLPGLVPPPVASLPALNISLTSICQQGKMEDTIGSDLVDHIVTDWPYGIDMANLQQENVGMDVSSVAAEHGVAENLSDFAKWMTTMYRILRDKGFCVIWCDQDHWHLQRQLAEQVGFSVQRWPLVWVKTHPCMNGAAQYNFTKATEIAMVCRKGNATLQKQMPTNYWTGDNFEARKKYGHPFAKPEGLWNWIYSAIALRGQSVWDPFAGRGSAVLPAISYGLQPFATELSDTHYPHLVNNIRAHYMELTNNNVNFV